VKILCKADPVPTLRANKRSLGPANGAKAPAIEIYTTGRYFCITGQILEGTPDEIVDATEALERLATWIAKEKPEPAKEETQASGELPIAFLELLERDAALRRAWETGEKIGPGSDRSASGLEFSLARYLRPHLDDSDLEAVLRVYPYGQIAPGKLKGTAADRRIQRILEELGARPERKPDAPRRLRFMNFADMGFDGALLTLIKGLLGHRQMVVLFGDSGSAKSLIALAMGMHIALGWAFCGRKVKQGFVAYLSPEGANSIALRAHAWAKRHGVNLRDIPIQGLPYTIDLCHDDADLTEIITGIRELEPELGPCVLVIIDTVSRSLAGGDENHPKDMGAFVRHCDVLREQLSTTVMPVHHTAVGGDEPRGHRSLRNAGDVRLYVTKLAEGLSQLEVKHAKDGANGDRILFRIETEQVGTDEDGEPIIGALVLHDTAKPAEETGRAPAGKFTAVQLRVLQEMRKQAHERRSWDFTFAEFADVCLAAGVLEGKDETQRRGACRDFRNQLANKKALVVDGKAEKVRLL
jgi:hypothetical protein